ncbi:TonB family protein [Roseateles sp. DAIF2]|uniref:energy transducer TonB n=1 Tax=Roseateles sp. DAIF2 TaxID=2714952 RepID=UPI0018A33799|nr:energy transducer TonB [Roseateles sp. DAIF2]QPF75683.1 TonB family protein [Roseateles sp. DAIF2]
MGSERHHKKLAGWIGASLVLALAAAMPAGAQELGDLAGKAKLSDSERAKRDADKVYQWIRFHADKAEKADKAAKAQQSTQAAPVPAAKPAAAPPPVASARAATPPAAAAAPVAKPAEPAVAAAPAPAASADQLVAMATTSAQPVLPPPTAQAARAVTPPPPPPEPVEEALTLVERVEPEFPRRVLQDRGGSVTVRFTVQPDGSVRDAEAVKSSHPRLVRGVLDAVNRWRFAPITQARSAVVEVGFRAE